MVHWLPGEPFKNELKKLQLFILSKKIGVILDYGVFDLIKISLELLNEIFQNAL